MRLKETHGVAQHFVDIHPGELRRGHFGKIAEAADDGVEIGEFGFEGGGGFAENFLKLLRAKLAGALEIFDGDLQGKERVAQFVGQALAGEPGSLPERVSTTRPP